jgi:hypothetical protein
MPADDELVVGDGRQSAAWDHLPANQMLDAAINAPPLLSPVSIDRTAMARHLSVTRLADLGAHEFETYYGDRFRRDVLQAAPAQVGAVDWRPGRSRVIGEIVHEVLRWWRPGSDAGDLDQLLESYAWEQGVINEAERNKVIEEARKQLQEFSGSDVYKWIENAVHVYRELPFIWEHGRRIIHGVIDILLQHPDQTWAIIDYKSSYLPKNATLAAAQDHARRFHMQVGAYAEAVLEQLQASQKVDAVALAVYIHYIHSGRTVEIARDEWRAALDKIEPSIGRLIGS